MNGWQDGGNVYKISGVHSRIFAWPQEESKDEWRAYRLFVAAIFCFDIAQYVLLNGRPIKK